MRKPEITTLFDHMYWVNGRLLDATERLGSSAFVAAPAGTTRDLRATLVHELDVEWSWRLNLQGRLSEDEADLRPEDFSDVGALREHWRRDEAEMRAWLESLTDERLEARTSSGLSGDRRPLWQYLMHIVLHAAQQQADAATALTVAGASPGEIGFGEYLQAAERVGAVEPESRHLRIGSIVFRVEDLAAQSAFWSAALDYVPRDDDDDDFVLLRPRDGVGPNVSLDAHNAEAPVPPRIHLDLYAEDQAAEVERLIGLGATPVEWSRRPADADYVILADPEGNRFCVVDAG